MVIPSTPAAVEPRPPARTGSIEVLGRVQFNQNDLAALGQAAGQTRRSGDLRVDLFRDFGRASRHGRTRTQKPHQGRDVLRRRPAAPAQEPCAMGGAGRSLAGEIFRREAYMSRSPAALGRPALGSTERAATRSELLDHFEEFLGPIPQFSPTTSTPSPDQGLRQARAVRPGVGPPALGKDHLRGHGHRNPPLHPAQGREQERQAGQRFQA